MKNLDSDLTLKIEILGTCSLAYLEGLKSGIAKREEMPDMEKQEMYSLIEKRRREIISY